MLTDCEYNTIKVLQSLSCMLWFIRKYGLLDARTEGNTELLFLLEALEKDLDKHIPKFKELLCKEDLSAIN